MTNIEAIKAKLLLRLGQGRPYDYLRNPDGPEAVAVIDALVAENEELRGHFRFLLDTLDKSIVENDGPDRIRWKGQWIEGPGAEAYFSTVRLLQKVCRIALKDAARD
jgi:hypothetical protein